MKPSISSRLNAAMKSVRALLESQRVRLAYVFGSAARGAERPDSDLDVAVLFDRAVRPAEYGRIRLALTTDLVGLTHTDDVDVVVLNEAPPVLTYNVIAGGHLILGGDVERVRFETGAIKRFIDTVPLRKRAAQAMRERLSRESPGGKGSW